ncbi:MAG: hypothetical protein R3314_06875 [Longimicrobiales bacterium]|nr:hypothetical protein [Longimicrobiales bacterium]
MHRLPGLCSALAILVIFPFGVGAQSAVVAVEQENFRAAPNGVVVAELLEGTTLVPGDTEGRWREATLEAWIWAPSVRPDTRDGHDLSVSASGGENLRVTPNGRRVGRAREGMLLDRVEERGDWIRVRRTAWIWEPSLRLTAPPDPVLSGELEVREPTREFLEVGSDVVVRAAPSGDTVARLQPGASVEVVARDGDWARVRIEGWTFAASLAREAANAGVLEDVDREALQAEPDRFRGRMVEWTVQFIALREAEEFRSDFVPGERFILARGPGDDAGFVYLAVPEELVGEVRTLAPLQRVRVVGRVRSVESPLTGAPVLELVEIVGR